MIERNTAAIPADRSVARSPATPHRAAAEILGCMVDRTAYVSIVLEKTFEREEATQQPTRRYCNALRLAYFRDCDPSSGSRSEPGAAALRRS